MVGLALGDPDLELVVGRLADCAGDVDIRTVDEQPGDRTRALAAGLDALGILGEVGDPAQLVVDQDVGHAGDELAFGVGGQGVLRDVDVAHRHGSGSFLRCSRNQSRAGRLVSSKWSE